MINNNKYENERPAIGVRDAFTFLLVGGGIGATLALLFAPKSGREMRHDIADASRRGYDLTVEKANELKEQSAEKLQAIKEKAEAAYDFAATKFNAGSESVSVASKAISDGIDAVHPEASIRVKHATGRKPASIF